MASELTKSSNGTTQIAFNGEIIAWNTQALQSASDTLKQIATNFEAAQERCKTLVPKINSAWSSTNGSVAYNAKLDNGLIKHFEEGYAAMTALSSVLAEVAATYAECETRIANGDYSTGYGSGSNKGNYGYTDGGFKTAVSASAATGATATDSSKVAALDNSDKFKTMGGSSAANMVKIPVTANATGTTNTVTINNVQIPVKGSDVVNRIYTKGLGTPVKFDIAMTAPFATNVKNTLTEQQNKITGATLTNYKDIAASIDVSAIKAAEILTKGSIPKNGTLCVAENVDGKPFVIRIVTADGKEYTYPVYFGNSTEMLSAAKTYSADTLKSLEDFAKGTKDIVVPVPNADNGVVALGRKTYYDARNSKMQIGVDYASAVTTPTIRDMSKTLVQMNGGNAGTYFINTASADLQSGNSLGIVSNMLTPEQKTQFATMQTANGSINLLNANVADLTAISAVPVKDGQDVVSQMTSNTTVTGVAPLKDGQGVVAQITGNKGGPDCDKKTPDITITGVGSEKASTTVKSVTPPVADNKAQNSDLYASYFGTNK